jgi:hypothetical protein
MNTLKDELHKIKKNMTFGVTKRVSEVNMHFHLNPFSFPSFYKRSPFQAATLSVHSYTEHRKVFHESKIQMLSGTKTNASLKLSLGLIFKSTIASGPFNK